MTHESFTLYITRLNTIREGLTDPKRIKFIDDIFEALRYKDDVIDELHRERGRLIKVNSNSIQEGADIKLKLEGCALRWGIPGWEIEHWLRMKPDAVVREVKFWQKLRLIYIELEGIKPEPIKKPKYSYKPLSVAKSPGRPGIAGSGTRVRAGTYLRGRHSPAEGYRYSEGRRSPAGHAPQGATTRMAEPNLLSICVIAFVAVMLLLALEAVIIHLIGTAFPERRSDADLVTEVVQRAIESRFPGARVVAIEEVKLAAGDSHAAH